MENHQENQAKLKLPGRPHKLKPWILPGIVLLLIALGWYLVIKQRQMIIQTSISTYQQTELEVVRSVARSIKNYVEIQVGTLGRGDVTAIEQEIFKLFVQPVRLLENGDAWIYAPEHIVFDLSSDFPDKYRGKNMAEIFALQTQKGATHYEAMVESVMNAREGAGWYVWLPQKGQEIAAWTPVAVGDYTWVIGLSTPLPEILESNGDAGQIRSSMIIMSLATLAALGFLMIWGQAALKQEQLLEAEREQRLLAETLIAARKQTELELVQRNAELLALLYAGATISTSLDLQVVLETITREMASLLGAERCTIFQWAEAEARLSMITGFGPDPQGKEESEPGSYNLADIPLARKVLAERYAQQLRITQPEVTETDRTYMAGQGAKTLLLLPMEFQNRIIGLIQALDNRTERNFTYVEIALAQLLANQAASALENAKLYKLAQESEANLKAIFDNSLQAFVLITPEAKIQAFNKAAAEGVRLTSGQELSSGVSIYELVPEAEKEDLKRALARTRQGEAVVIEKKVKIAQQEKWFEYRYNPVFSEAGQVAGICFSAIDIDERKRAADTLAASEARLLAEMHSVLSSTRALVSETQLNMLLDFIITQAKQLMKTDGAVVLLLSEDGQYLELTPLNDSTLYPNTELQLPLRGSLAELAIATHTVQTSNHSRNDDSMAAIRKLLAPIPLHTFLYAPLEIQGQALGVLLLWSKNDRKFTDRDTYLVYLFADQAALALYNARLHVENRRLAIEQERQRLARELHDSVTQSLYSIGMAAQAALRLLNQGQESRLPEPITYIHQLSQTALAEMRERVYDLHPTVLKDRDLVETLKGYCDLLSEKYGLAIDFTASKDLEFTIYQRENLYYIAREALWNVVKHAGPTQVKVQLAKRKNQIVLSIADRGPGFALSASQKTEMMGLRTMEERAKLLRGAFEIHSEAGSGTRIVVQIPSHSPHPG